MDMLNEKDDMLIRESEVSSLDTCKISALLAYQRAQL
jgi:hypothetical protein